MEDFIKLPDDKRVIFLEPEPYTEQFQNVDSITGKGIKGVTNKIKISGPGGNSEETQMSNANGYFAVTAKAGYRIEIISECDPAYNPKTTVIGSFSKPQVIKMKPRVVDITFRTVDADYTDVLVENCKLTIRGSESGIMQPTNSGKGEFTVKSVRITEQISITASKQMYETNDYTIKNKAASYLADASTPASARIIPMKFKLDPCDMKAFNHTEGLTYEKVAYNLGKRKGVCTFRYNTCDKYADHLLIYNCPPDDVDKNTPVWQTPGPVLTNGYKEATFKFSSPIITVVAKSHDNNGTNWDMEFKCENIKEIK